MRAYVLQHSAFDDANGCDEMHVSDTCEFMLQADLKVDQTLADSWDLAVFQKGRQASGQQVASKAEGAVCQCVKGTLLRGIELS